MNVDTVDEMRRAVAQLIGEDPETWPTHGNAPLAITAVVAQLSNALLAQPVRWEPDGTPVGGVSDEQLHTILRDALYRIEVRNGWDSLPEFAPAMPNEFGR